ncbi:MAG: dTDP-3-amino-3,6-dideoxy-alpha-D-galactopyranose transaminase [Candidatus Anoxychlamydiales bacterium]|nr:dTDP-3-amino-3,6-dideoxy-alpha-D-galactopyranose transaminase [Candidatus Anoxychlamydiales bacterium]NGX35514.1 dTDP-3-amino-3,6-dideoxy-alpha-D-galactopyranose transaminase [Candidatus Anoxychlamydiales bacterium]
MYKVKYVDLAIKDTILKEEILDSVNTILTSGQFILGEVVKRFEENIARYLGVRYAIGVNSGTDALSLCLRAFGIGDGDEVITTSNSFLATASAIIETNAKPVFVDISDDLNIDPELIEEKITTKTKAIMPVHLSGKPAKMNEILKVARKYNLKVIEDAAQSIGTEYFSKKTGSIGDVGCFSMHPLKTLNACGDAGLITTNDKELYLKLKQFRNLGLKNRNESDVWGYNSRLDAIQAAVLDIKLKYIDSWIEKRRQNAKFYIDNLKDTLIVPKEEEYEKHSFHTFVIQTENRDVFQKHLEENKVETKIHYPIPIHKQKAASYLNYTDNALPKTCLAAKRILSLPIYQDLTDVQLEYVIEKIQSFFPQPIEI